MRHPVATEYFHDDQGPIESLTWGMFAIRGESHGECQLERLGAGKDIRIMGKKVTRWKERKGHRLKKSMVTGVYDKDLEVLVIGAGIERAIEVPDKTVRAIREHGISEVFIAPTPQACRMYNELYRKGKRVGLLAHGTC